MPVIALRQAGPLPIKANVKWPTSEPAVVVVSGSAWTQTADSTLEVIVNVGGEDIGTVQMLANAASTHLAFPSGFFPTTQPFGDIPVMLRAANSQTVTDQNDLFTVALLL